MGDLALLAIVFSAAMNGPASVASRPDALAEAGHARRAVLSVGAWIAASAMLAAAVLLRGPLLDVLDISLPTLQIAAGVVMVVGALRPLAQGRAIDDATASLLDGSPRAAIAPLAMPLIASPAAIAAAMAYSERAGEGLTMAVAAAIAGFTALSLGVEPIPQSGHRRAFGAIFSRLAAVVLLVAAVALIVDGVQAV